MTRVATATSAFAAFALAGACLAACAPSTSPDAAATAPATESPAAPAIPQIAPTDYSQPAAWLCHPGAEEVCAQDASVTVIAADGHMTREHAVAAGDPMIDCFYVYPTVSRDPAGNSDIVAGDEERAIVRAELAPFAPACRLFVPMYRQVTVSALKQMLAGQDPGANREAAYADIAAAWRRYLDADNQGRGVVLIGHGQGAGLLARLVAAEIDGKPAEKLLVSALLPGTAVDVPMSGALTGGAFAHVPLCTSGTSTGCVISYASFRADAPPPTNSLFGAANEAGMKAACVNPAEIGAAPDGPNAALKAELPVAALKLDAAVLPGTVETPFVALPGLMSATCVDQGGFSYLAIASDPADKRAGGVTLDAAALGEAGPEWGLGALDLNLAMGNLVDIVKRQGAAWLAEQANPQPATLLPPH